MTTHTCGTEVRATIDDFVRHLADCPETQPQMRAWAQEIVSAVVAFAVIDGTADVSPTVSRDNTETRAVSAVPDIEELAVLRDGGMSYRDLANVAGVAPETVRRRLARHAERSES